MKLIEQMAETARYVEGLEAKAANAEATCEDLSRVIACFVRVHGGLIPGEVWDELNKMEGFIRIGKRAAGGGVEPVGGGRHGPGGSGDAGDAGGADAAHHDLLVLRRPTLLRVVI